MDLRDYYVKAMLSGSYRRPEWIRSIFGVFEEDRQKAMQNPFAYRLIRQGTTFFYVNPEKNNALDVLVEAPSGMALLGMNDTLELRKSDGIPGVDKDIVTTYGIALVNWVCVLFPFQGKIPFQNPGKRFMPYDLEALQVDKLVDNPKEGEKIPNDKITVDEHLQYMQGVRYLEQFMPLFTPAGSEKTLTCSDALIQRKNELFEQYKDKLTDPAVLARIAKELETIDRAWMKGDVGEDTLIGKKDFAVVRRELFGFSGGNQGFDGATVPGIKNSLSEGWDIKSFPDYNDALRVASYDRGHQTALGGYQYKQIVRSTSNTQVSMDDCGSKIGIPVHLDEQNVKKFFGLSILTEKGLVELEPSNMSSYLGKIISMRSPMTCKASETDYCVVCVGKRLSLNKTALSGAMANVASTFQNIYMQAAHGKELATAQYHFETGLS